MQTRVIAIETGQVRIKTAQATGRGKGVARQINMFRDPNWTGWLPTLAFLIDHRHGPILVDTGQARHLLDCKSDWHPYLRSQVQFRIEREEEIDERLRALGVPVRGLRVILTHLHIDHDGGLALLPGARVAAAPGEFGQARGLAGRLRGYLPARWPAGFNPAPLVLGAPPPGLPFTAAKPLTADSAVVAVATPGHTAHHISILVELGDAAGTVAILAGDAVYSEANLQNDIIDGVSGNEQAARDSISRLKTVVKSRPSVVLPTHDPGAAERIAAIS
jgi:glyoxylase-like metal-dependent hydrolase (beta-lactamase superfamily II)